ncbi:MAG TPA: hypothetical protein VGS96_04990 [Thermoanaerobaculia bacterium]|jgi:hypothetical protein|nr:hypothetical protein [Thermoanaerobaculia bacterium]
MKRALAFLAFVAAPAFAIDCTGQLTHLGTLYQLRSMMMRRYTSSGDVERFIDRRVEELREPLPSGGYRWVRWMRPTGEGPTDKKVHNVVAVQGAGDPDSFEAIGEHAYAVRVAVPSKRSLFKGNNPVYVGDVKIDNDVTHVNRWMNPDTSQTFDLHGIYDRVVVTAQVSTGSRDVREAVAEIHFKQAVMQDDPANPAYSTIKALERVRETPDPATVDAEIAALETTLFPASESLPLLTIMRDLRRADELIRSEKADEQEKGNKLLKETLRRLR